MREYMTSHTKRVERFKKAMLKLRNKINGRMAEMFGLLKELTSSTTPEKVLVMEEVRNPITKNVNAISLCRIENEKVREDNEVIDNNIIEHRESSIKEPSKMEFEDYHSLPKEPMRKVMLKKMITKKVDMGENFVIPCNIGGLKYMDTLVDQGSDVNVMPLSTYNRLIDEKLVETDIRLSLASQLHIYPLGIDEDVLVEVDDFVYPVDFVILDIKEDRRKPFIPGTPFLTTARAEIKFDKGTITLKSGKNIKEDRRKPFIPGTPFLTTARAEIKFDKGTITLKSGKSKEERTKLHHEKELEFNQWRNKMYNNKNSISKGERSSSGSDGNQGGVTTDTSWLNCFYKALSGIEVTYLVSAKLVMRKLDSHAELELTLAEHQLVFTSGKQSPTALSFDCARTSGVLKKDNNLSDSLLPLFDDLSNVPVKRTSKHGKSNTSVVRRSSALSWETPVQEISLNLTDHDYIKRER
ncbi:MAK10-like protein [Tanacetum coccineum]